MGDAPPVKPWGIANKNNLLQKLIEKGKVDITKTAGAAHII
jgi:hypothetical protein